MPSGGHSREETIGASESVSDQLDEFAASDPDDKWEAAIVFGHLDGAASLNHRGDSGSNETELGQIDGALRLAGLHHSGNRSPDVAEELRDALLASEGWLPRRRTHAPGLG